MIIQKNTYLKDYSTFGLNAKTNYFVEFSDDKDLLDVSDFVSSLQLPCLALGGGSNIIFCSDYPGVIIKNTSSGIEELSGTKVRVGAGVALDEFVKWSIDHHLSGLEPLSGIPGTVGGAIALCAGAYGATIKDTLHSVRVYDIESRMLEVLETSELRYWHRSSIFREKRGNDLIILDATFKLHVKMKSSLHPKILALPDDTINSPEKLREAVLLLRQHIPNPSVDRNSGSFFLNPTIPNHLASELYARFPEIAMRPFDSRHQQISAGWLLEKVGLRGQQIGPFVFHKDHANIVINSGSATGKDLMEFIKIVQGKICGTFGIHIVAEPLLIGEEYWQGMLSEPTIRPIVKTY